MTLLYASTM